MTELSRISHAAVQAVVDDNAAANTRAEGDHSKVGNALCIPDVFRIRRSIVLYHTGQARRQHGLVSDAAIHAHRYVLYAAGKGSTDAYAADFAAC